MIPQLMMTFQGLMISQATMLLCQLFLRVMHAGLLDVLMRRRTSAKATPEVLAIILHVQVLGFLLKLISRHSMTSMGLTVYLGTTCLECWPWEVLANYPPKVIFQLLFILLK